MSESLAESLGVEPWDGFDKSSIGRSDDESLGGGIPAGADVIEIVNRILGYDILESQLMAEGYLEFADESLTTAEGTMAAFYETLPPE